MDCVRILISLFLLDDISGSAGQQLGYFTIYIIKTRYMFNFI